MKPTIDTPLTDDELDTLDACLLESGLDAPMDISMLDGFLCAVLSGPAALPPTRWLPWVWDFHAGEQAPEFRDPKEGKYLLGLIMRFAYEIARTLTHMPEDFEPLFPVRETGEGEIPVVDEWCFGYLKGTALSPAAWQSLMDAQPAWFETIRLHGTEEGWKQLEELVENRPDADARHIAYVERIAPAVRLIHAHWLVERGPLEGLLPQDAQPIRNLSRPGRNDPCPCGSGRKYKLCHGASN